MPKTLGKFSHYSTCPKISLFYCLKLPKKVLNVENRVDDMWRLISVYPICVSLYVTLLGKKI